MRPDLLRYIETLFEKRRAYRLRGRDDAPWPKEFTIDAFPNRFVVEA